MAKPGCSFQTKNRYRFGWFSMKLKLVGGDSAGVVTAYYMISDTGKERDELVFEFLGNRTGQSYTLQTNIYKGGIGGREMRHMLWFDPTKDFHTYSFLWNDHQIVLCGYTKTQNWWDQYDAWILSDGQKVDFSWVGRNLVIYDYCRDTTRYPKLPAECSELKSITCFSGILQFLSISDVKQVLEVI
ncbi:putative xyloglucan endotransglucosylase/hydrolase protein 8 [Nymphaea thermarum]|nr:putative xyloglucan endotransglucosylase/hydrolase protein 8 [Nymphaea thermarum]